jgi:nucleotide-binding universal stress UspA family protein
MGENDMTRSPLNAVVVGFDGSTGSGHALEWGAREAERRHRQLQIIHVWQPPPMLTGGFGTPVMPDSEAILEAAVTLVDKVAPDVTVTTQALPSPGSVVAVAQSSGRRLWAGATMSHGLC